jgi:RND family efflux transporter MFP subunit
VKKKFIIIGVVVIILIFLVISIVRNSINSSENLSDSYYEIYTVKEQDFSDNLSLSGKVSSDSLISITSDITGVKVNTLNISVGDTVKKGQVIAKLDVSELQSELNDLITQENSEKTANQKVLDKANSNKTKTLNKLESIITSAKNDLENAKSECNKDSESEACDEIKNLEKELTSAQDNYNEQEDTLNEAIEDAQNAVNTSTYASKIKELKSQITSATIYSPEDGLITAVNVNVGSILTSENIATLQTSNSYKVTVTVPEAQILKIKEGMKATITTVATGDETFEGTITKVINIPSTINNENETYSDTVGYSAIITIDNENTNLLVGMTAKCKIYISEDENLLSVPYDAVKENINGEKYVYKLEQNQDGYKVIYTTVLTGKDSKYYTEIKDGLSTNDLIMITDAELENGYVFDSEFLQNNADFLED